MMSLTKKEVIRYDNGGWAEIQYLDGQHHGNWTVFHQDGSKSWERFYIEDQKSGPEREWHGNGQLKFERHYKEDELHGSWKEWHENGQLKKECQFEHGEQTGTARWYRVNGEVLAELNIADDGKRSGSQVAEILDDDYVLHLGIARYDNGSYLDCEFFEQLPEGYRLSK